MEGLEAHSTPEAHQHLHYSCHEAFAKSGSFSQASGSLQSTLVECEEVLPGTLPIDLARPTVPTHDITVLICYNLKYAILTRRLDTVNVFMAAKGRKCDKR
jgi:hypothetical protein